MEKDDRGRKQAGGAPVVNQIKPASKRAAQLTFLQLGLSAAAAPLAPTQASAKPAAKLVVVVPSIYEQQRHGRG